MEFLKEILGEELYKQFEQAVNTYNSNEANKDKQIKLANLTEGGYVSKDKFLNLETDLTGKVSELEKANELIGTLKKSSGQDEELQGKITTYETEIETLKRENEDLKTENELKFALAGAGADSAYVDYLVFKAKEKGEIKLDDAGKVKGIEDLISGLKTQLPNMFPSDASGGSKKIIDQNKLPDGTDREQVVTKEKFLKMGYAERLQFKKASPEQYKLVTQK